MPIFALFSLLHAVFMLGWRRAAAFFAVASVLSLSSELAGVRTGLIFGRYVYTDALGPKILGDVPYVIPLAWFMMIYPAYVIASLALDGQPIAKGGRFGRLCFFALVAAMIMTAWDLTLDPYMVGVPKAWNWHDGGPYFGIPFHNYVGWVLTTFLVFLVYWGVGAEAAAASARPDQAARHRAAARHLRVHVGGRRRHRLSRGDAADLAVRDGDRVDRGGDAAGGLAAERERRLVLIATRRFPRLQLNRADASRTPAQTRAARARAAPSPPSRASGSRRREQSEAWRSRSELVFRSAWESRSPWKSACWSGSQAPHRRREAADLHAAADRSHERDAAGSREERGDALAAAVTEKYGVPVSPETS